MSKRNFYITTTKVAAIRVSQHSPEKQKQQEMCVCVYMERKRKKNFKKLTHTIVGADKFEICKAVH